MERKSSGLNHDSIPWQHGVLGLNHDSIPWQRGALGQVTRLSEPHTPHSTEHKVRAQGQLAQGQVLLSFTCHSACSWAS